MKLFNTHDCHPALDAGSRKNWEELDSRVKHGNDKRRARCYSMMCFICVLLMASVFLSASNAFAGGPFVVDTVNETGTAQRWQDDTLMWYSDAGDLATGVSNATAVRWVTDAIDKWLQASIQTENRTTYVDATNVKAAYQGSIGFDIDETNYTTFLSQEPGPTVIIFDKGGEILKKEFPESYHFIPGITQLILSSPNGKKILKGVIVLNGLVLDENTLTPEQFQAPVLHELGHLFNLDHSQVNLDIADLCTLAGDCTGSQYIPTMFPELKTYMQRTLTTDDKITISWLYPSEDLNGKFCKIAGKIQDANGNPLQGVNVVARRVNDGLTVTRDDSRSMVSGVLYPACSVNNDGGYYLYGIIPGKTYEVIYEPLTDKYTLDASGFEPLDDPPSGFESGNIVDTHESTTISCATAGETIQMQTIKIDTNNPCVVVGDDDDNDNDNNESVDNTATKSSGCSLIVR